MKARFLAGLSELRRVYRNFMEAWTCPRRGLAMRFVIIIMFFSLSGVGFVGFRFVQESHRRLAALKKPVEIHTELVTEEASSSGVFQSPIPQEVEMRRDGIQEAGKDLAEPEIEEGRSIASIAKDGLKMAPYNPFYKIGGIVTTTADQGTQLSRVAATVTLEVDSSECMREIEKKQGEFKYMIASLISEQSSVDLRTPKGKAKLKTDVFREVNYHLQSGKIKDVLIEEIIIQ
jgi:flagellar basal body-associated protein FliL